MTDQYAADLIALPQGGGAIKGLGETFQPDLHTGTGNFSVPLELPPGRGGLSPTLTLSYSSGNGNGPLGLGWQLSVPGIRRKTDKRIPTYDDRDVFVLSGAEDLVPVRGGDPGVQRYRPKTESLFARIEHHTDGSDHWVVWSKDGLRTTYGTPRPGDAGADWRDDAAIADPDDPGRIFGWMLTRTADTFGNHIAYGYQGDAGDPQGAQRYLEEIRYADYGDAANPSYLVTVKLTLGTRPDSQTDRRAGFPLTTASRIVSIETWTNADVDQLVRSVALQYADQAGAAPVNAASLLTSVTVTGHDGDEKLESLPSLEFQYGRWNPSGRRYLSVEGSVPPASLSTPGFDLVDLFGRGLPDVVQLSGTASRYWRNRGDASIAMAKAIPTAPAGVSLGQPGVQILDADGDGRPDLVVTSGGRSGYFPFDDHGGFDAVYRPYPQAPSFGLTDPETRLVDLDGDGVADVLRLGGDPVVFLNDRRGGWTEIRLPGSPLKALSFADPRVRLADMSGDGLLDVVLVGNGHVRYWPNLGYGSFGTPVDMMNSPRFDEPDTYGSTGFDPARLLIGDVDGDGMADVIYVGARGTTVWVNLAGTGFAAAALVPGTPQPDSASSVRLVDFLGTGTSGILWTYGSRPNGDSPYKFLDLTGGAKPYLLTGIDNHVGGQTVITYAPSTQYALADAASGSPWQTTLPFPVQVVSSVVSTEEFSGSTTSNVFTYHHGYWDGADREFRGFGRVDQRDTTTFDPGGDLPLEDYSPPTETRTWFHSGPVGPEFGNWAELDLSDEYWDGDVGILGAGDRTGIPADLARRAMRDVVRCLRGLVLRTELYGLEGDPEIQARPYTISEHTYDLIPVIDPEQQDDPPVMDDYWRAAPVVAIHSARTRTTQWERGDDPMTRVSLNLAFDGYGNFLTTMDVAVPRGRNIAVPGQPGEPLLVTVDTIEYAVRDDADHYMCDRLSGKRREEILNDGSLSLDDLVKAFWQDSSLPCRTLAFAHTFYDGDPFVGLPPGQLGDHGVVSATATLALTRGGLGVSHGPDALPPYLDGPTTRLPHGLRGEYFRDTNLQELAFTRADRYVGFDWSATSPDPDLSLQRFSVHWTGQLQADFAETYTIALVGTGGARLWLDGAQVIDAWDGMNEGSAAVPLSAGSHDLNVEYQAADWNRAVALRWSSASQPEGIIDSDHLTPPADFGPTPWDASYPDAFREDMPDCAGYVYYAGQNDGYEPGYYVVTGTSYDGRGLPTVHRDALGNDTVVSFDEYGMFPLVVTDPAGLKRSASYDYRVLKAYLGTDVNANRSQVAYSPLGLPLWTAALGKADKDEGDTPEQPGTVYSYHLTAYDDSPPEARQPLAVHTVKRVDYRWAIVDDVNAQRAEDGLPPLTDDEIEALFPPDELQQYPERFVQSRAFNDGAGRVLQTRTQSDTLVVDDLGLPADVTAAPGDLVTHVDSDQDSPLVIVSSWRIYDNKGRVIQAWEPFFDKGWDYAEPADVLAGLATSTTTYDCRGRQLEVRHPDGSADTTVYGAVPDLTNPAVFLPNAWESYHYDPNDNAGRTSESPPFPWQDHWNTPSSSTVDPLGRVASTLERLPDRALTTLTRYDIQGRVVEVVDTLGRIVSSSGYDVAGRSWKSTLLDAGTGRTVYDAAGAVIEHRDAKGAMTLTSYDALHRSTAVWACDASAGAVTVREVSFYGDAAGLDDPSAANLNGKRYRVYDQAGSIEFDSYEFGGRLLTSIRRVLSAATLLSSFPDAFICDWQPSSEDLHDLSAVEALAATLEDQRSYPSQDAWDALGRRKSTTTAPDYSGATHVVQATYSRSGALTSVAVDEIPYLQLIAYNARGQRLAAWFANGVVARYAYDPLTFRLLRQRSERCAEGPPGTWRSAGAPLQDTSHAYDLVGNPLSIMERSPGCGAADQQTPDALDRSFTYDAIYRLLTADGREQRDPLPEVWSAAPRSTDVTSTQTYDESYSYDDVGNLASLVHHANSAGYTRTMTMVDGSNRLANMSSSAGSFDYGYDPCGNLTSEAVCRLFDWDASNRLSTFRVQAPGGDTPSVWATYRYDGSGQRVMKLVRKQGDLVEMTIYAGGPLERLVIMQPGQEPASYDEIHIHDNEARIAVHSLNQLPDDRRPQIGYHLADHLGNAIVTIDDTGSPVNREEYLPYGETSFGSYARKRYRYTGKERDEESGLNYHAARYYAPWLGRWTSTDPLDRPDDTNRTQYASSGPLRFVDPSGLDGEEKSAPAMSDAQRKAWDKAESTNDKDQEGGKGTKEGSAEEPENRLGRPSIDVSGKISRGSEWSNSMEKGVEHESGTKETLDGAKFSFSLFSIEGKMWPGQPVKHYDSGTHSGSWFSQEAGSYEASALTVGYSTEGKFSADVANAVLKGYEAKGGYIHGDWIAGVTEETTFTAGNLEGNVGFHEGELGLEGGASVGKVKEAVGVNFLNINVSIYATLSYGVEAGMSVGKTTGAKLGVIGAGIDLGWAKTSEAEPGFKPLLDHSSEIMTQYFNTGTLLKAWAW